MQYLLLAVVVIGLAWWLGRDLKRKLRGRDWRIAVGTLSTLAVLGGGVAMYRGASLIGGALMAAGLVGAIAARLNFTRPAPQPLSGTSDAEARAILGVGPNASEAEIREAYSRLMRMAHPDRGGTDGLAAQLNAARDRLLSR